MKMTRKRERERESKKEKVNKREKSTKLSEPPDALSAFAE
jgi:hypothetical protein